MPPAKFVCAHNRAPALTRSLGIPASLFEPLPLTTAVCFVRAVLARLAMAEGHVDAAMLAPSTIKPLLTGVSDPDEQAQ
ncbi:protein of unknown function [Candidatus Filomicrobium marinum]|uniref:Uncharacterized protein n=1 Tax=Candidatus Filomicrobium marinum TaxID=1608628 RepID=A0A0D6JFV1_9HYPH|nr:protein of unknown function [Candidatus Filomicrobium marinum]CPR18930.1 protein of unknown function [Candidatus Filomicrobium marinum]